VALEDETQTPNVHATGWNNHVTTAPLLAAETEDEMMETYINRHDPFVSSPWLLHCKVRWYIRRNITSAATSLGTTRARNERTVSRRSKLLHHGMP
jgi:hypothetical protein